MFTNSVFTTTSANKNAIRHENTAFSNILDSPKVWTAGWIWQQKGDTSCKDARGLILVVVVLCLVSWNKELLITAL